MKSRRRFLIGSFAFSSAIYGRESSGVEVQKAHHITSEKVTNSNLVGQVLLTDDDVREVGYLPPGKGAVSRLLGDRVFEALSVKDYGAYGDGIRDDRVAIQRAIDAASILRATLFFPSGIYLVKAAANGAVLLGKSYTNIVFSDSAIIKLTNPNRYYCSALLDHYSQKSILYRNLQLDASFEQGANVFGANNSSFIRLEGGVFKGGSRSPKTGGGRGITFQFNCHDIHVSDVAILDCTTGLDFHGRQRAGIYNVIVANATVSSCEEAVSFYDLMDSDSALNVGGDVQVLIKGLSIYNCGRSSVNLSVSKQDNGTQGGVIVSERARSFSIDGVTIFNDPNYGKIGGIFRGTAVNARVRNITAFADVIALFNLSAAGNLLPVKKYVGFPIIAPIFSDVSLQGACDYILLNDDGKGGNSLYQGQFLDIVAPTPRLGLVNEVVFKRSGTFLRLFHASSGSIFSGYSDLIAKGGNFFRGGGEVDESYSRIVRKQIRLSVQDSNDQLVLEQGGEFAGAGRVWASNDGVGFGSIAYKRGLVLSTMDGSNDVVIPENSWKSGRLRLGDYRLWVDSYGVLRIKRGDPISDTDGIAVGAQE